MICNRLNFRETEINARVVQVIREVTIHGRVDCFEPGYSIRLYKYDHNLIQEHQWKFETPWKFCRKVVTTFSDRFPDNLEDMIVDAWNEVLAADSQ